MISANNFVYFNWSFSDCEIKEPAKAVLDTEFAEELYNKTCELCQIDGQEVLESIVQDTQETEYIHV